MPLDWSKPPRVVAHRGASAEAPENTFAAFERALAHTPAFELDVHLARDGVPVVLHDDALDRTTDGRGPVRDRTSDEVRRLSAGAWFGPAFARERVPLLEEAFERFGGRALLDVEMKSLHEGNAKLPEVVGRLVLRHGLRDRVLVTSFDPDAVHAFKVRWPEIKAGVISPVPLAPGEVEAFAAFADALAFRADVVTAEAVAAAKRQGLLVLAWTVNDAEEAARLWRGGVDAVVSDVPGLLAGAHGGP